MKVKLADYTRPADVRVAQAALTSYWSEWNLEKLEKISEKDAEMHVPKVLSYGHEGVLEHVVLQFAVEGCSRSCTHQLVRHRHMSFVQRSQRYISEDGTDLFVVPPSLKDVRMRIPVELVKKPIRIDESGVSFTAPPAGEHVEVSADEFFRFVVNSSKSAYDALLSAGVTPEDARYVLPQAVKSKIFITMNFREFKHFIGLRTCMRAQWEIRLLAWKMLEEVIKHDDLRKLVEWARVGPRCVQLGYCPERELMPEKNCVQKMKERWKNMIKK